MKETTFEVPEVHCDHCKSSIENALIAVDGVTAADVKIEERVVAVSWDDTAVDTATLVGVIEDQGYSVAT